MSGFFSWWGKVLCIYIYIFLVFIIFLKKEKNKVQIDIQELWYCILFIFIYLGFYVAFNTVQVISRWVVGRAEETSTYSLSGFCTVNCRPTASNNQLSHLRPCREPNPSLRGGRPECYNSATVVPLWYCTSRKNNVTIQIYGFFEEWASFAIVDNTEKFTSLSWSSPL